LKKFLIIFAVVLVGCTHTLSHREIRELAPTVDIVDGVDRIEAIIIAQNFMLRNGLYDRLRSLEPYRVINDTVWYKDGEEIEYVIAPRDRTGVDIQRTWTLYFKDKRNTWLFGAFPVVPYRVIIDAGSGQVINWGLDKLGD